MAQVRKKKRASIYDPQKEKIINELSSILGDAGYVVRREKLKQGFGWKVLSGSCRFEEQELIFVDRRLPQDEQISFIINKIVALNVKFPQSRLQITPERLAKQLSSCFVPDLQSSQEVETISGEVSA